VHKWRGYQGVVKIRRLDAQTGATALQRIEL